MKKNYGARVRIALMGIPLAFLLGFALWNLPLVKLPVNHLLESHGDFSGFVEEVQEQYTSSISHKNDFINLNGWFAGAIDQTICNDVVKLKNGMLTQPVQTLDDVSKQARNLASFKEYLDRLGIQFLYVQAPFKCDLEKRLLPAGINSYSNDHAEALLSLLEEYDVPSLDLLPELIATPELVEKYFTGTDHHWNFTGAFTGFQRICERLQEIYPERNLDISFADLSQWNRYELDDWYLGSHGKRVGIYYGGVEDVSYYLPKFETSLISIIPRLPRVLAGDFVSANVLSSCIEKRDYFGSDTYLLYSFFNYPLYQHRNPSAPNDLRLLLVEDSCGLPVHAFLSTMFQEVEVIDPRTFTQSSVAKYIRYYRPDIVIELIHPNQICNLYSKDYFEFDVADASRMDLNVRSTVFDSTDFSIRMGEGYMAQNVSLKPGRSYLLQFDDIEFSTAMPEGCALGLFDSETGRSLFMAAFDIEYSRAHGDFSWFFTVPEDAGENLELRFCAGMPDNAPANAAVYRGVRLEAVG